MSGVCFSVSVSSEIPFRQWWSRFCQENRWPADMDVERWNYGGDFQWAQVLDSFRSFSLFNKEKAIVILQADRALKGLKEPQKIFEIFSRGPHRVVLQIEDSDISKKLGLNHWIFPETSASSALDQKAAFKWIDAVHAGQTAEALEKLEDALRAESHPMGLVQLMTRDFRIGRLIHYAHQNRFRESEITTRLKVQAFVVQKWLKRPNFTNSRWSKVFDLLLETDLQLKSGIDSQWVLRKMTLDLIELSHQKNLNKRMKVKRPLKAAPLPWIAEPSFA